MSNAFSPVSQYCQTEIYGSIISVPPATIIPMPFPVIGFSRNDAPDLGNAPPPCPTINLSSPYNSRPNPQDPKVPGWALYISCSNESCTTVLLANAAIMAPRSDTVNFREAPGSEACFLCGWILNASS